MTASIWDASLQPERTNLAWRRTCISVAATSLVGMRVAAGAVGVVPAVILGLIGLTLAVALWVRSRRRYDALYRRLRIDNLATGDGLLLIAVAGWSALAGLLAAAMVLVGRMG